MWRKIWHLIELTVAKWKKDNISWLAASLAYYTLFSIAPTFIILITLGGEIFSEEAIKGEIVGRIQNLVGFGTATAIQKMIEAGQTQLGGALPNILSIGILLFTASNVFIHLKDTLNKIWNAKPKPRHWVMSFVVKRVLSFVMVFSSGVLLLVLIFIEIILASFGKFLSEFVPAFTYVYIWQIGAFVFSFLLTTLLFATIYKIIPDTKVLWQDVWIGAAIAAFLFSIGKSLMGLYFGHSRVISLFGAASSFIIILVWVYYSSQLLFIGAAFSYSYATQYGSRLKPKERPANKKKMIKQNLVKQIRRRAVGKKK